jgi:peptide-methionine (R)-S-oxide reductase
MAHQLPSTVSRRSFCLIGSSLGLMALAACRQAAAVVSADTSSGQAVAGAKGAPPAASDTVTIVEFSDGGGRKGAVTVPKVVKSDAEWRKQLSPLSYSVTRHADTELAFTGPLLNEHAHGVFRCVCCATALFSSETKFDSGTGWPSFYQPIAKENVSEDTDKSLFMDRTAVSCSRCNAHLGHVFDDGPQPTGLRYCMNSAAMTFGQG